MKIKFVFLTLIAIHSSFAFSGDNENSRLLPRSNPQTTSHFDNGNDNIYFQRKYGAILIGSSTGGGVIGGMITLLQPSISCTGIVINATSPAACLGKIALLGGAQIVGSTLIGFGVGCVGVMCYRLWNSQKIEQVTA